MRAVKPGAEEKCVSETGMQDGGQQSGSGVRGTAILLLVVLVIGGLIWAGVHNARSRRLAMQQVNDKAAARATLVPDSQEAPDSVPKLEGKVAPGFTLTTLDGKKVSLADYKGKPVLVNFWATWCGPCKLEMPWLEEFHKKYESKGLVVLGVVAADQAGKSTIESVVNKAGVTYPVLLPDDKVETAYGGVNFLPESFYVGRDGKVVIEAFGTNDGQGGKDLIEANIQKLLAAGGQ